MTNAITTTNNQALTLQDRISAATEAMRPAKPEEISKCILALHRGGLHFSNSTDPKIAADLYIAACKDIPLSCIKSAASKFNAGAVSDFDGRFMPSPAKFAQVARSEANLAVSELARLKIEQESRELLAPKPRKSEESKAAVRSILDKFRKAQSENKRLVYGDVDEAENNRRFKNKVENG
jgi:hypothetical protein